MEGRRAPPVSVHPARFSSPATRKPKKGRSESRRGQGERSASAANLMETRGPRRVFEGRTRRGRRVSKMSPAPRGHLQCETSGLGLGSLGGLGLLGLLFSPFQKGDATLTFDYFVGLLAHGMKCRDGCSKSRLPASQASGVFNGSPPTIFSLDARPAVDQRRPAGRRNCLNSPGASRFCTMRSATPLASQFRTLAKPL